MSDLRGAAFESLRQAANDIDAIPENLTMETIKNIKIALRAVLVAQYQAVKWLDEVEF